ncbi:helix-turn-helix domain-containing protein [Sphingomonas faeni]|uniref:helix-turn-helix domain-containing protein n=1 Tax=Sphingomonas faeni TaxID=185950 RepID=UPI0033557D9F
MVRVCHVRRYASIAATAAQWKVTPASVDVVAVRSLRDEGVGPSGIAKRLGIGRASVYRALEA